MSDPMTNLQIEDVLSSIRRLVAEGDKTRAAEKALQKDAGRVGAHPAPANSPERLVLTPALRVSDDVTPPQPAMQLTDPVIDPEPARLAPDSEQKTGSVSGDATLRAAMRSSTAEVTSLAAGAATLAALKNPVSPSISIVPDTAESDDAKPDMVRSAVPEPQLDMTQDAAAEPAFRHFDREALSKTDVPLRAVSKVVEDDTADYGDDFAQDDKPDPQIDEKLNAFLSDDAMLADAGIDEDTLRALIVDVIREELQGVMGERITRNVRKLVRREIHRVLAAQDFD